MSNVKKELLPFINPFIISGSKTYIDDELKYYDFTFIGTNGIEGSSILTSSEDVNEVLELLAEEYPIIRAYFNILSQKEDSDENFLLQTVVTSGEIEERWELPKGSVMRDLHRGKFGYNEVRKSGQVWLFSFGAAVNVYGSPKKEGEYVRPNKVRF